MQDLESAVARLQLRHGRENRTHVSYQSHNRLPSYTKNLRSQPMYQLSSSQPDNTRSRGYVPPYTPMNSLEFLPSQTPVSSPQNGQLFQSDKQVSTSPLGSASKFSTRDSFRAIALEIYEDSITLTPTNTYKPRLIPATTSNTSTTSRGSWFDTLSTTESSITMFMVPAPAPATPRRLVQVDGANKNRWYTVIVGRRTGIFDDW
jgi:hypothetical protein